MNDKDLCGTSLTADEGVSVSETPKLTHVDLTLKRTVTFSAAFDKRHSDPKKNYGIHGVDIRFVVSNEFGAVQFVLYTNWQLPHVTRELMQRPYQPSGGDPHWMERPMPSDLGYHSPWPMYDGQSTVSDSCEYLKGRPATTTGPRWPQSASTKPYCVRATKVSGRCSKRATPNCSRSLVRRAIARAHHRSSIQRPPRAGSRKRKRANRVLR